jgi:hypothetical protein
MALTDNWKAYWKCDETSWDIADSIGSNTWVNNGTTGFTTWKINNWINFDNTSWKYFNCWATGDLNTAAQWFSFRFKSSKTTEQYIYSNMDAASDANQILIATGVATAGRLSLYACNKSSAWWHTGSSSICDWNLHHLVINIDSSWFVAYLDWNTSTPYINVSSSNALNTTARTTRLWFRYWSTAYPAASMVLDEFYVRSSIFSTAEVTSLYNSWNWIQYPFAATSNIKTVNWLNYASVKTWNWLAKASVKTINWLS